MRNDRAQDHSCRHGRVLCVRGAARFKELLGQTPLEYVTEWRMQKAMQLLQQRDKKLIDVARSVGYESDAAFSKAFKRVVGANPGEYLKRGYQNRGHV